MSVIYDRNYDVEMNIGNVAQATGFKHGDLTANYFSDETTGEPGTIDSRSGGAYTIEDGDYMVYMTMSFGDTFMPMEAFHKHQVHRKIFRSTIRTLFKKHTTQKLQKFLVALFDDMSHLGWEVAVFLDTPNKIPMVQFYHPLSKVGLVPLPVKKKEFMRMIKQKQEDKRPDYAYQNMCGHLANS